MEKVCTKCKIEKPLESFRKNKRYKCGHQARCKECMISYEKSIENHERKLESRKKYRESNRERIREQDKQAYWKNPSKFRSKARVSQRRYFNTEKGKFKYYAEAKRLRKLYPEKARARSLFCTAVCEGKIKRQEFCTLCKASNCRIEGHHYDYSKPYDVIWVCKSCHTMIHNKEKLHRDRLSEKNT